MANILTTLNSCAIHILFSNIKFSAIKLRKTMKRAQSLKCGGKGEKSQQDVR